MSKILEQDTEFTDIDVIREALEQQGFSPAFKQGYAARTMHGFAGATFRANLGVTKSNFTAVTGLHTYGDLGFAVKADGTIGFIADDYLIASDEFETVYDGIKTAYAEKKYVRELYKCGFAPQPRNVTSTGEVELIFTRVDGL